MTISCTIKIGFDAAKRLLAFSGPCNQLHGYHHDIEAEFEPAGAAGNVVMDFVELERILTAWTQENWDHTALLNKADKPLGDAISAITGQTIFYMEEDPSAEALADYLRLTVAPTLFDQHNVKCTRIRLHDTAGRWVESRV